MCMTGMSRPNVTTGQLSAATEPAVDPPPPGYAVALLCNGQYAPLGVLSTPREDATGTEEVLLYPLSWQTEQIPPAQGGSSHSLTIAFDTYSEALSWCWRRQETSQLLAAYEEQAARTECYPDRSVWYRDEALRLLRAAGYCWMNDDSDQPFFVSTGVLSVTVWITANIAHSSSFSLRVEAANLDEAWERVYAAVAFSCGERCPFIPGGVVDRPLV